MRIASAALVAYAAGGPDFADCLIRAMNRAAGCSATLTFDRAALALPGFVEP